MRRKNTNHVSVALTNEKGCYGNEDSLLEATASLSWNSYQCGVIKQSLS